MRARRSLRSIRDFWRNFLRHERGSVAVYLALGMLVFMPVMGIALDVSRFYGLNTEMANAAEAAALAAAEQMDFTDEGLVAADQAARTAVDNYLTFATDGGSSRIAIVAVQFLWALPPAGQTNYDVYATTDGADARYVRVITEARELESLAMRRFLMITGGNAAAATKITQEQAVAAKTTVVCRVMPMMMCNPIEDGFGTNIDPSEYTGPAPGSYDTFGEFLEANPLWTRRMFRVKFIGPGAMYEPGVAALLEPMFTAKKGAAAIENEFALDTPDACIVLDQAEVVDVKTGQAQTIVDGINVRFDVYRGKWKQKRNDMAYQPGPDVVKGHLPQNPSINKTCDPDPVPYDMDVMDFVDGELVYTDDFGGKISAGDPVTSLKLPQDECFNVDNQAELDALNAAGTNCYALGAQNFEISPGNNKGFSGRIGNGKWDIGKYFAVNHPDIDLNNWEAAPNLETLLLEIRSSVEDITGDTEPVSFANPPSRYAVYRWELGLEPGNIVGPRIPAPPGSLAENGIGGNPGGQCSASPPEGTLRRMVYIAVVNCGENAEALSSGDRIVPVLEFLEVFLTEMADANNGGGNGGDIGAIYVEPVRGLGAVDVDNVVMREVIQLYKVQ